MGKLIAKSRHRVMCGDSTDKESVNLLMRGEKAQLCLTDPPYGLGDTKSDKNNYDDHVDSKENLTKLIAEFLPIAESVSDIVVLTPGNKNHRLYPDPSWEMAWFVPAGNGVGPWGFCCWQPVLCYGKDPYLANGLGSRPDAYQKTESAEKDIDHPCSKPVGVWEWFMNRSSISNDDLLFEPFCGSGTTIIAAEKTNRRCFAMELSPNYVDVCVKRWQEFTGKSATLEGCGRTFETVKDERIPSG